MVHKKDHVGFVLTVCEVGRHDSHRVLVDVGIPGDPRQSAEHVGLVGTRISVQAMDDDDRPLDFASNQALAIRSTGHVVDEGQVGSFVLVAVHDAWDFEECDLRAGDIWKGGIDDFAGILL